MTIDLSKITHEDFEFLIEDILKKKKFKILVRPSRGPDRGQDIIAERDVNDDMNILYREIYLVQCKHFAKSNKSVKESDIKNVVEKLKLSNANRYLLATSTLASGVVNAQLKAISDDDSTVYKCAIMSKLEIVEALNKYPLLAHKYFGKQNWKSSSSNLVKKIRSHFIEAHRGAILFTKDVTAVFGNDGYKFQNKKEKMVLNKDVVSEIKHLRQAIKKKGDDELTFAASRDGYSWVLLVNSPDARYYNDIIWTCGNMPSSNSVQYQIAHKVLWPYFDTPLQ